LNKFNLFSLISTIWLMSNVVSPKLGPPIRQVQHLHSSHNMQPQPQDQLIEKKLIMILSVWLLLCHQCV